jgi:hypothetical protein
MITAITIAYQVNTKYSNSDRFMTLDKAGKNLRGAANHMAIVERLANDIATHPNQDAKSLMENYFGVDGYHVTNYTKKRRTFSAWMVTIHEEDI